MKSLLKEFNKLDPKCFQVLLNIRKNFRDYYKENITTICDKDKDIIKDIKDFDKIDEFAYILNLNVKNYIKRKKDN